MVSVGDIRSALIDEITNAFANVERGDGVSLHEADVIDDAGSDEQRAAARRLDTETRWQDVPNSDIEHCDWVLSFLDAEGLHYYMPAYMVWALRNYQVAESMSIDSTIYTCEMSSEFREWSLSRFQLFTPEQRQAVCRFLRFMADYSEGWADEVVAQRALDNYWSQFCTGAV